MSKSIGTIVEIPENKDSYTIMETVSFAVVEDMDNFITSKMFEVYKDTEVSKIFVLDEPKFKDFLVKMLPLYLANDGNKDGDGQ